MAFAAFEGEGEVASASGTTAGFHPSPAVVSEAVDLKWVTSVESVVSGFGIVIKLNDGSDHMRATATLPKSKVNFEAVLNRTELEMAGFNPHDSVKDHFELLSDAMRSPDDGLWTDASLVSVSPVAAGRWDANAIGDLKPHRGLPTAKGVALRLTVFEKVRRKTRKFYLLLSAAEFSETDELREKCAHLEANLQKSKREIAEMKKQLTGMAALREDNERMQAQLKEKDDAILALVKKESLRVLSATEEKTEDRVSTLSTTATSLIWNWFTTDTGRRTQPDHWRLSEDLKTATKLKAEWMNILCAPPLFEGSFTVKMRIGRSVDEPYFYIGFVEDKNEYLQTGCCHHCEDGVCVYNEFIPDLSVCDTRIGVGATLIMSIVIAMDSGWPKATVTFELSGGKAVTTVWIPKSLPVYAGFLGCQKGIAVELILATSY